MELKELRRLETELSNIRVLSKNDLHKDDYISGNFIYIKTFFGGTRKCYIKENYYPELLKYTYTNPSTPEDLWKEIEQKKKEVKKSIQDILNKQARDKRRNNVGLTTRETNKCIKILKIKYLKEKGFKNIDIAKILGITKGTVSKYLKEEPIKDLTLTTYSIQELNESIKSFLE